MTLRFRALLGAVAHGIREVAGSILSLVGLAALARFLVPALIVVLGIAAVVSAQATAQILAGRPDVTRATAAEVIGFEGDPGESIWFQFEALVDSSFFETTVDQGTFFYLARDPEAPERGIIVRSPLNDAFFRERVLGATLVADPDAVAAAVDALGALPSGLAVERGRYLDETASGGEPEQAFVPSDLDDEPDGSSVLVNARIVSPGQLAACAEPNGCEGDDASWWYVAADPQSGASLILRSPHPPHLMPLRLEGLFLRDTFDLAPVLESDWLAESGVEVPTDRSLRAESRPPITVEASWAPTIAYAAIGLFLLASLLAGYPVFGSARCLEARRALEPGERIDVDLTGRLVDDVRTVPLARSPGAFERLAIADLALLLWRYGLLPRGQSRREAEEAFVAQAAGERDRLVIHERDQSALVVVGREAGGSTVEAGRLHRVTGSVPAVRFRQGRTDAYLEARSNEERDRIAAALAAEAAGV